MKYDSLAKRQAPAGNRPFSLADIVNEDLALQNPRFNDLIWSSSINPPSDLEEVGGGAIAAEPHGTNNRSK